MMSNVTVTVIGSNIFGHESEEIKSCLFRCNAGELFIINLHLGTLGVPHLNEMCLGVKVSVWLSTDSLNKSPLERAYT